MARYVAFLRAINVGGRRVAMAAARDVLSDLGPTKWLHALPDNLTTARNMTMLTKLAGRL